MGELHVNMISTLDGVIQANGGPTVPDAGFEYAGWERPYWGSQSVEQMDADARTSDALLLGRTTYDIFRAYWPGEDSAIAQVFNRVPKYVASRGTPELSWDASIQIIDVAAEVRDLRGQHQLIHTWGSANLVQALLREALVDQLNLWLCPVVLGRGKKLFPDGAAATRFAQLEPPRAFPEGIVLLRYRCLAGTPETANDSGSGNAAD